MGVGGALGLLGIRKPGPESLEKEAVAIPQQSQASHRGYQDSGFRVKSIFFMGLRLRRSKPSMGNCRALQRRLDIVLFWALG